LTKRTWSPETALTRWSDSSLPLGRARRGASSWRMNVIRLCEVEMYDESNGRCLLNKSGAGSLSDMERISSLETCSAISLEEREKTIRFILHCRIRSCPSYHSCPLLHYRSLCICYNAISSMSLAEFVTQPQQLTKLDYCMRNRKLRQRYWNKKEIYLVKTHTRNNFPDLRSHT